METVLLRIKNNLGGEILVVADTENDVVQVRTVSDGFPGGESVEVHMEAALNATMIGAAFRLAAEMVIDWVKTTPDDMADVLDAAADGNEA